MGSSFAKVFLLCFLFFKTVELNQSYYILMNKYIHYILILHYCSKTRAFYPTRCTPLPAPLRRRLFIPPLVLCAPHAERMHALSGCFFHIARSCSRAIIDLLVLFVTAEYWFSIIIILLFCRTRILVI